MLDEAAQEKDLFAGEVKELEKFETKAFVCPFSEHKEQGAFGYIEEWKL